MARSNQYKYKVDNRMQGFGDTNFEKRLIRVNKKRNRKGGGPGELLDTIVHESLHARHPKASEKKIVDLTDKRTRRMSKRTKKRFYSKLK